MSESTTSFNRSTAQYRPLHFGVTRAIMSESLGGVRYLKAEQPLAPCAQRLTDRLVHWAQTAPERTFMAHQLRPGAGQRAQHRTSAA